MEIERNYLEILKEYISVDAFIDQLKHKYIEDNNTTEDKIIIKEWYKENYNPITGKDTTICIKIENKK